MKVIAYREAAARTFDGGEARGITGRVAIGATDGAEHFCMRIFTVAPGGFTPRHIHDWEHEIFIHAGHGAILRDGTWLDVQSGTVLFIPGGEEHQLKNRGSEDLVFVCLIPAGIPEL